MQILVLRELTHKLQSGTETTDEEGRVLVYFKATGTIEQGAVVAVDKLGEASAGVTYASLGSAAPFSARLGIALAAMTTGQYGWALRKGVGQVYALPLCAANVPLYTSGTAGRVDDTSTTQNKIQGLRLDATVGATAALTACTAVSDLTCG